MRRCTPRKQMCLEVEALECRDAPSTLAVRPGALHAQHRGAPHHLARRKHHPKAVAHGPSGVVSIAFTNGPVPNLTNVGPEVFLSPTVTVKVAAGQSVFVSASASLFNLGSKDSTGKQDDLLLIGIEYQPAGGPISDVRPFPQLESLQPQEWGLTSLSAVLSGLAPGTYQVGLAGELLAFNGVGIQGGNGAASALVFQGP